MRGSTFTTHVIRFLSPFRLSTFLFLVVLTALLAPSSSNGSCLEAQESKDSDLVALPELYGYKLPKERTLLFRAQFDPTVTKLIRDLRRIPAIHTSDTASSLILEKYLHRKSRAIQTEYCYIESDWMTDRDLEMLAAVAQATALATRALFETSWTKQIKQVVLEKREDYYALVDAWSESPTCKSQARQFDSVFIGEYRCGARAQIANVLSLVIADAVTRNEPASFYVQEALREGLHVFVTSMIALHYETFVSPTVTTPSTRRASAVDLLFETAKQYMTSTPRDNLETVLDSELNTLTLPRLSVAFSFINFLLEGDTGRWTAFHKSLESAWTADTTPDSNPERRKKALRVAVNEGLNSSLHDLDKQLQEFVSTHYLLLEDLAALLNINREIADSVFQGFLKVCELKRSQKPVSEKGERLYQEIQARIDKKLHASGQRF